jgi:hypothetical protein
MLIVVKRLAIGPAGLIDGESPEFAFMSLQIFAEIQEKFHRQIRG